jgi:hypothetical protein
VDLISTPSGIPIPFRRFRSHQCYFPHLQWNDWYWARFFIFIPIFLQGADLPLDRIFATPSVILRSAGSVGMALVMWLLGATVAATGSAVYLEYGTVSVLIPFESLDILNWATDTTSKRRREELSRIRLQTPQVYGDVCLCYVCVIYCEPSSAISLQASHR